MGIHVRLTGPSLVVVPVSINGRGPYDFLFDTGSTATMIDERLATDIGLTLGERTTIVSIQGGETTMLTAEADRVSVGAAEVRRLKLGIVKSLASVPAKVRGVLGEDFLRHFDLLLDYRRRTLQFDSSPSPFAEMLAGERIPIRLRGHDGLGVVNNRVIVGARILSLTPKQVDLLLDTGTNAVVLYGNKLHLPDTGGNAVLASGNSVSSAVVTAGSWQKISLVAIGQKSGVYLSPLVIGVRQASDVDGLLPASAFRSIFISHSGGFVIFNPSWRLNSETELSTVDRRP
jgi:hypothetical protein